MPAVGDKATCAVSHSPGYVPGECGGEIHLYRAGLSTAEWWLCDTDAAEAPARTGIPIARIDEPAETTR